MLTMAQKMKLPKFVRAEIEVMEQKIAALTQELQHTLLVPASQAEGEAIVVPAYAERQIAFGAQAVVRFRLRSDISVRLDRLDVNLSAAGNALFVTAEDALVIRPHADNRIGISVRPRL